MSSAMHLHLAQLFNSTYNFTSHDSSANNNSFDSTTPDLRPPLYLYVYVTLAYIVVFSVGLVGNALVVQVVASVRSMRKRMNYFLVSLSVADLLVILVGLPTGLHEFYGRERWILGEVMCKIVPYLENASHHCSVLTLLAIGFERYYAICHPLKKTVGSRLASATILIPAVWIISCVVSAPFAIISNTKITRYFDDSLVETCKTEIKSKLARAYIIFIAVGFLAVPLLLLTVLYSAIIRTLHSSTMPSPESCSAKNGNAGQLNLHQNSTRNERVMASRRQVLRMMVGVMSLYFLCLVPLRCVQLWHVFGSTNDMVTLGFVGYLNLINCVRILIYVNSAGNPIIYALLSSNFRAAFKQSFSCRRSRQLDFGPNETSCCARRCPGLFRHKRGGKGGKLAGVKTVVHQRHAEESCHSPTTMFHLRSRSNSDCSHASSDRVVVPLLSQVVLVSKDSEVLTSGHQASTPEPAYV